MSLKRLKSTPTLRELMLAKQDEMEAALTANRRIMPHEGEKGAAAELRWREMLADYLPNRYSVRSGFVVDYKGNVSQQIDVIIHDAQYSPFLFTAGTAVFVPAESVYAIFDAKQDISKDSLQKSGEKVASVRSLERTSGDIYTFEGKAKPGKPPADQDILGGVLAVTSDWRSDPFGAAFADALDGLPGPHRLDLGVAVSSGAFSNPKGGERTIYDKDTALVGFFTALVHSLQRLGTALAMNLEEWTAGLRTKE